MQSGLVFKKKMEKASKLHATEICLSDWLNEKLIQYCQEKINPCEKLGSHLPPPFPESIIYLIHKLPL